MIIQNILIKSLRYSIYCIHDIQLDENETINY